MDATVRNACSLQFDEQAAAAAAAAAAASGVTCGEFESRSSAATCAGCQRPIRDQFVLHVDPDLDWHSTCLRCCQCQQQLDENCTCFVRDGQPYCKADYTRLFGVKCSRCGLGFDRINLVMRARDRVYHVDCFRCVACNRKLIAGDEFAFRPIDFGLVCRADYDVTAALVMDDNGGMLPALSLTCISGLTDDGIDDVGDTVVHTSVPLPPPVTPAGAGGLFYGNNANNNNNNENEMEIKSKANGYDERPQPPPTNSGSSASSGKKTHHGGPGGRHHSASSRSKSDGHHASVGGGGGGSGSAKTTRIRTVLNEKQLHTLRTCYAANPRPDALMKDQLVEMTGLSSRVIRVWFQNKRCKDKKRTILIKQLQQQHQDKVHGVPMIASSPVRMQDQGASILQASAVQIHHQYVLHSGQSGLHPPTSLPLTSWSSGAGCQPCSSADYNSAAAVSRSSSSSALTPPGEIDVEPAAFQQLLDSFGCHSDDDDTVVSVDEPMMRVGGGGAGGFIPGGITTGNGSRIGHQLRSLQNGRLLNSSGASQSQHLICADTRC